MPQIELALKLNLCDTLLQNTCFYKGHTLFHLDRHQEALEVARQLGTVATSNIWRVFYHLLRVANLIELNWHDETQAAIDAALVINQSCLSQRCSDYLQDPRTILKTAVLGWQV